MMKYENCIRNSFATVCLAVVGLAIAAPLASAQVVTPAQIVVQEPADQAWIEGLDTTTGVTIRTRDGHELRNVVKVLAIKEMLTFHPAAAGDNRDRVRHQSVSVLVEPNLGSPELRQRMLSSNARHDDLTIVSYRGTGGRQEVVIKGARLKEIGTTTFEGRGGSKNMSSMTIQRSTGTTRRLLLCARTNAPARRYGMGSSSSP